MEIRSKSARHVQEILDVLLTQKRYEKSESMPKGIAFDLVLVLSLPLQQKEQPRYIAKDEVLTIGEMRKAVPHELNEAYSRAIEAIQRQTNKIEKNRILLNYCGGLRQESSNEFDQQYAACDVFNVFELMYNTLVYTLQHDCGFHCEKIIVMDKIFLLLNCTDENLMRAAQKYGLKKEVLYSQIDIMLNQPLDARYRPLRFNRFLSQMDASVSQRIIQSAKSQLRRENDEPRNSNIHREREDMALQPATSLFNLSLHKKDYRKIGHAPATDDLQYIQQQQPLTSNELINYYLYLIEYYGLLNHFNELANRLAKKRQLQSSQIKGRRRNILQQPAVEVPATNQQLSRVLAAPEREINEQDRESRGQAELRTLQKDREYLNLLMPRKQLNRGCFKMYRNIKNRHAYFILVKELMERRGYNALPNPAIYTSFFRLNKHKKFADRLQTLLMFKPLLVGPDEKYGLFLRMERAKLAYLILQEFLRVENFPQMGIQVFTLHNTYEKSGKKSSLQEDRHTSAGGLDGLNLQHNWKVWTPWRVNHKLIRDYLGEKPAFFVMLKSHLILYLLLASPFAAAAYVIIQLVIPNSSSHALHLNQFCFFLALELVLVVWLTVLSAQWERKSEQFMSSFVEKRIRRSVLPGYRAPYVRNLVSDLVNDFRQTKSFKGLLIESANYLVVVMILGIEIAIFYGIRVFTKLLTEDLNDNSFLRWQELIPIFIFFCGNQLLYSHVLKRLFDWLTSLQNNPDLESNDSNRDSKRLLFLIGLQLIGPIDLLIVEPINRTSCSNVSCYDAFDSFIEARFIVIFVMLLGRFLIIIIQLLVSHVRNQSVNQEVHQSMKPEEQGNRHNPQHQRLIRKLVKEYGRKEFRTNMEDQIMALVHIALFSVTIPIAIVINLIHVLLEYYLERLQILHSCRRPINFRSLHHSPTVLRMPIYLFCIVNAWMQFITFEDWEYVIPTLFSWVLDQPTLQNVLTFKIVTALVWAVILMLISKLIRHICEQYAQSQSIITRSNYKLKQYLYNFKKGGRTAAAPACQPLQFIGRVQSAKR